MELPKWFEKEFESLKLQFRIEESNDDLFHAIVTPIEKLSLILC